MTLFKSDRQPGFKVEIAVVVLLLAVAAFFRFTQLNDVPPGMTHDEAAFGAEAERILGGQRPVYFALGYGHEPLYAYLVAGVFSVLGRTLLALRVASAACGMLVVGFTYGVARRLFGVRAAWIAAAWMAVAFWPVSLSRQALRAITLPMVWLPAAWFFWGGLRVRPRVGLGSELRVEDEPNDPKPGTRKPGTRNLKLGLFAFSGLFLGATFYTYMASRLTWLAFPLLALYMLLRRETRRVLQQAWPGVLLMLAVAGLVALPLALYLRANPASEIRVGLMMEPIRELLAGKPDRALGHAWNAVRVYSWVGDRFWAYNIPGRPVFHWTGSVLFYLGLAVALWRLIRPTRWQDARFVFLVIWLLVGMAPAMVTTNEGIFLRAIVAQPAAYLLVAVGLCALGKGLHRIGQRLLIPAPWTFWVWAVLAVALIGLEAERTGQAYLIDWPSRPEARNIYNYNLVAAARYLAATPTASTPDAPEDVAISALYPLYYHDPWIWRYVAGREDLRARWFDGRGAIVYPGARAPAAGGAVYVFSSLTPLHPALRAEFEARATLVERRELDAEDENPAFEVWRWQGQEALSARLQEIEDASPRWVSPEVRLTEPELRRRLEGAAPFGDVLALIGYRLDGETLSRETLSRGEPVELVTYWRALRTVQEQDDWKTFVHLLDVDSVLIGGVDVLNAPPTGWLPGDVIVQVHTFLVDPGAPPGEAHLEVGVYRDETGRLPVIVDGQAAGDRVLLAPVEIEK